MAGVENHLDHPEATEAPPEPQPKPTAGQLVLGTAVAALFAVSVVVASGWSR
jgi:hypothetical protein